MDIAGKKFGRLTALDYVIRKGTRDGGCRNRKYVKAKCECGKIVEVLPQHLKGEGRTRSCGCFMRENASKRAAKYFVTLKLDRRPVIEWIRKYKLPYSSVYYRIAQGMSPKKALLEVKNGMG